MSAAVTGGWPHEVRTTYPRLMRAAFVALLAIVALAGCAPHPSTSPSPAQTPAGSTIGPGPAGSSPATASGACRSDYTPATLPTWAQAGFTPPTQPMAYVMGDNGDIVAILWAEHDPLQVPPAADRNNKILWVSRVGGGDLHIRATLESSGQTVTRSVQGGPGPSIIDLPTPGCWSLDLTWGTASDHMQLEYVPR